MNSSSCRVGRQLLCYCIDHERSKRGDVETHHLRLRVIHHLQLRVCPVLLRPDTNLISSHGRFFREASFGSVWFQTPVVWRPKGWGLEEGWWRSAALHLPVVNAHGNSNISDCFWPGGLHPHLEWMGLPPPLPPPPPTHTDPPPPHPESIHGWCSYQLTVKSTHSHKTTFYRFLKLFISITILSFRLS